MKIYTWSIRTSTQKHSVRCRHAYTTELYMYERTTSRCYWRRKQKQPMFIKNNNKTKTIKDRDGECVGEGRLLAQAVRRTGAKFNGFRKYIQSLQ